MFPSKPVDWFTLANGSTGFYTMGTFIANGLNKNGHKIEPFGK